MEEYKDEGSIEKCYGALVSVIVPVFNVEKYLEKCIHSILAQTHSNLEIILIDDGSTDKSGEICDYFAEKDERIVVFHTDNMGVSSARNCGLKVMKGDYFIFVDSDDWVESEFVMRLLEVMEKNNADFVVCNIKVWRENQFFGIHTKRLFFGEATDDEIYEMYNGISMALHSKMFDSDKLNGGRFDPSIAYGEDLLFIIEYITKINKMITIDYLGYNYVVDREGNVVSSEFKPMHLSFLESGSRIHQMLRSKSESAKKLYMWCEAYIAENMFKRVNISSDLKKSIRNKYNAQIKTFIKEFDNSEMRLLDKKSYIWQKIFVINSEICSVIVKVYLKIKRKIKNGRNNKENT